MGRIGVLLITGLVFASSASAHGVGAKFTSPHAASPRMWRVFTPGTSWSMRSSVTDHLTRFHLQHLTRWGCWKGDIIDLVDTKRSISDYWEIGQNVTGHQIELREPSGAWRMIGTYARSDDPSEEWTMQVHGYHGMPTPYEIIPARQVNSDTQTEYYTLFSTGIVPRCLTGGPQAAPAWGRNVYWRSRFTFTSHGVLHARYEENRGCGAAACQVEQWTYAPDRSGIEQISDLRGGGHPANLVLQRVQRPTRSWTPGPTAFGWRLSRSRTML